MNKQKIQSFNINDGFIFPTDNNQRFKQIIKVKQINQDGNTKTFEYVPKLGPFIWDVNDYLSQKNKNEILSNKDKKQSIIVGIPTYHSEAQIYKTIIGDEKNRDVLNQLKVIKDKNPDWQVEIVVNITPYKKNDETIEIVKKIQKKALDLFPKIKMTIFIMDIRRKVNAMNVIADYAEKVDASILCFLDDDTLHYPKDALLKCIERLIHFDDIGISTYRYLPPKPKFFYERLRTHRFRLHPNKTVTGRCIILYTKSYPRIPHYLNSDDLYLSAYFIDVDNPDPFHKILVVEDSHAISKIAGKNLLFGLKVLRRSLLGFAQLLATMPIDKKKLMSDLIKGNSLSYELKLIYLKFGFTDAIFYFLWKMIQIPVIQLVKKELFLRKLIKKPKLTIDYFRDESTFNN